MKSTTVMCPNCGKVFVTRNEENEIVCPRCKTKLVIENGEVKVRT